eukprot:m.169263 g.169263  ORF g.169263 m.169263 type:complete len:437 (+) comp38979_c0_seq1:3432-4742(+)
MYNIIPRPVSINDIAEVFGLEIPLCLSIKLEQEETLSGDEAKCLIKSLTVSLKSRGNEERKEAVKLGICELSNFFPPAKISEQQSIASPVVFVNCAKGTNYELSLPTFKTSDCAQEDLFLWQSSTLATESPNWLDVTAETRENAEFDENEKSVAFHSSSPGLWAWIRKTSFEDDVKLDEKWAVALYCSEISDSNGEFLVKFSLYYMERKKFKIADLLEKRSFHPSVRIDGPKIVELESDNTEISATYNFEISPQKERGQLQAPTETLTPLLLKKRPGVETCNKPFETFTQRVTNEGINFVSFELDIANEDSKEILSLDAHFVTRIPQECKEQRVGRFPRLSIGAKETSSLKNIGKSWKAFVQRIGFTEEDIKKIEESETGLSASFESDENSGANRDHIEKVQIFAVIWKAIHPTMSEQETSEVLDFARKSESVASP